MRVAIVHPWFLVRGGSEQTVGVMAEMFPDADIYTLFCDTRELPPQLKGRNIVTSMWNWLPGKYHFYRYLLPLLPYAFEAMDLRGYDLVLSSDSCLCKGVLLDDETTHVCFCHSPMHCLYDLYRQTLEELPWLGRALFRLSAHHLRTWDCAAARRVTGFAANSQYIANRIRTYYGLESQVVYPPVETGHGYIDPFPEDYYLCVGRLVSAKRVDLIIEACNRLNRRLVIAGRGRELANLRKIAGPTIEFREWVSDAELAHLYAGCRALLFAAREDFGIVPLECQSYGRPVIAYGRGGTLETVIPGITGLHFEEQTAGSLMKAIFEFEAMETSFDPKRIQANARSFSTQAFKNRLMDFIAVCLDAKRSGRAWTEICSPEPGAATFRDLSSGHYPPRHDASLKDDIQSPVSEVSA